MSAGGGCVGGGGVGLESGEVCESVGLGVFGNGGGEEIKRYYKQETGRIYI